MPSITANTVVIRKALNGPRAVYSVAKHPKLLALRYFKWVAADPAFRQ